MLELFPGIFWLGLLLPWLVLLLLSSLPTSSTRFRSSKSKRAKPISLTLAKMTTANNTPPESPFYEKIARTSPPTRDVFL